MKGMEITNQKVTKSSSSQPSRICLALGKGIDSKSSYCAMRSFFSAEARRRLHHFVVNHRKDRSASAITASITKKKTASGYEGLTTFHSQDSKQNEKCIEDFSHPECRLLTR